MDGMKNDNVACRVAQVVFLYGPASLILLRRISRSVFDLPLEAGNCYAVVVEISCAADGENYTVGGLRAVCSKGAFDLNSCTTSRTAEIDVHHNSGTTVAGQYIGGRCYFFICLGRRLITVRVNAVFVRIIYFLIDFLHFTGGGLIILAANKPKKTLCASSVNQCRISL